MSNRREFIKQGAAAGMIASIPEVLLSSDFKSFSNNYNALKSKDDTTGIFNGLSTQKNVGALIGKDASGRPVLFLDGKPASLNPGVILRGSISRGNTTQFASIFRKAGLDQLVLMMNLGNLESDHRLWTGPETGEIKLSATVSFNDDTVGRTHDMNMQRDMWRREYARLWVAGNYGAWQQSFATPSNYDHPEILEEIRFLHEQMHRVVNRNTVKTKIESLGGHSQTGS